MVARERVAMCTLRRRATATNSMLHTQFIVGVQALPGNPYDGPTLCGQIAQVERLTGIAVERAYVDRGYRGH